MSKIKILCFIITILFGVFMFVYSEIDDSPGGQLIGLLVVIVGIVGIFKKKKGLMLTKKEEKEVKFEKDTIRLIPIWKWLLEN